VCPKRPNYCTLKNYNETAGSFASVTHLPRSGVDIRQSQELLGHNRVEATMIHTHVLREVRNPAGRPLPLYALPSTAAVA
jgi:hypothetical protein